MRWIPCTSWAARCAAGLLALALLTSCGGGSSGDEDLSGGGTPPPANSAPTADAGQDVDARVGDQVTLDGSGSSDPDDDPLTYQWSIVTQPGTSTATLQDATTATPSFAIDVAGNFVIELVVSDGQAQSAPDTVRVMTLNTAPSADAGPDQTVAINETVTLDGAGSTDVDGDALTYRWTLTAPAGSGATLSDPLAIRPTFVVDVGGTYVAELVVSDGKEESGPDTVLLYTVNSAPVADAGPDQTVATGALVELDGSASSDVDGDVLSYTWTLTRRPDGSNAQLSNPGIANPGFVADAAGEYVVTLTVNDGTHDSEADSVRVSTANSAPVADAGADLEVLLHETAMLDGSASFDVDGDPLTYLWSLLARPSGSAAELTGETLANPTLVPDVAGTYVVQLIVNDGRVQSEPDTIAIEAAEEPPDPGADSDGDGLSDTDEAVIGTDSQNPDTDADGYSDGEEVDAGSDPLNAGSTPASMPPPDPASVAPPLDPTVVTQLYDATTFLYTGASPVQTAVGENAIDPLRTAVVRGQVSGRSGKPISGVTISIKDHPELGRTRSRADGMFDLVVNGGGPLVVDYRADGYLPAQRRVEVEPQSWTIAPDVVLIPLDPNATTVALPDIAVPVVASGKVEVDADGSRQAHALFKPGITAEMVLPDGSTAPLSTLTVRATEYTVGANGPETMPGELPPMTGYTYAVELSVDEALAAGATSVVFSQPVPFYVDNFLGFPTGTPVPLGYYDRASAQWIGAPDGRVIEVLADDGGVASLDTNGDGEADDPAALAALGIDEAELARLADLYDAGATLWRAPIPHFTPWDLNFPYGPPPDARPPDLPKPAQYDDVDESCEASGSIIECHNQVLGERVHIAGTPYSLNYRSSRTPGRGLAPVSIPVTGSSVPASALGAWITVEIAGRRYEASYTTAPNQSHVFSWDGLDAYDRPVFGTQQAVVTISHDFPLRYLPPAEFATSWARASGSTSPAAGRDGQTVALRQRYAMPVGQFDTRADGLGGWSLDVHHRYDPVNRMLYRGDGQRVSATASSAVLERVAGADPWTEDYDAFPIPALDASVDLVYGLDFAPDGSLYYTDLGHRGVFRLAPDGVVHRVAGTGEVCAASMRSETLADCGIPGPATQARFNYLNDIAVAPDGTVYVMDEGFAVFSIGVDGMVRHVAGSNDDSCWDQPGSTYENCALEGKATDVYTYPYGIDVGPDGALYIADLGLASTIGRVDPDGNIATIAGTTRQSDWDDKPACRAEGTPASRACLIPFDVAVSPDGTLYVLDFYRDPATFEETYRVVAFGPDGLLNVVFEQRAEDRGNLFSRRLAVDARGQVYLGGAPYQNQRIHLIDPVTETAVPIAGTGNRYDPCPDAGCGLVAPDGHPALATDLREPVAVAAGPDGLLYFGDYTVIRRVTPLNPGLALGHYRLASDDGAEVYEFDATGRHLRTLDGLTGETVLTFTYDETGRLVTLSDREGRVTRIERDANGNPLAIVGPYGQRTALAVGIEGWLSEITNPAGDALSFEYGTGGLLTRATDRRGHASSYEYDAKGRLVRAVDREGHAKTLSAERSHTAVDVSLQTALGRTTSYSMERLADGTTVWTTTAPSGAASSVTRGANGVETLTYADGTVITRTLQPDARHGLQAPAAGMTLATPGGLTLELATAQEAEAGTADPFSVTALAETVSIGGRALTSTYDAATRSFVVTTPGGRQLTRTLDLTGRLASEEIAGMAPVSYAYDADGRLANVTYGSGGTARAVGFTYGDNGRLASIADPLGRTQFFGYDEVGRTTSRTLADGRTVRFEYDPDGRTTAVIPPGRPAYTFTWTPRGRLETFVTPAVGDEPNETRYAYDADGALAEVVRADGRSVAYVYDAAGRLSRVVLPEGEHVYTYAADDSLASVAVPDGLLSYTWDGFLLREMTWSGAVSGSVTRTYDQGLRVAELAVNGTPVAYAWDDDDLLVQAGDLGIARDPVTRYVTGSALGNVADAITRNGFGEITAYTASHAGTPVYSASFERDALGRIASRTETVDGVTTTWSYAYDDADRLIGVQADGTTVEDYAYDENGNRRGGPSGASYSYDDQDRLLSMTAGAATTTYTYTASGERATRTQGTEVTTYTHNALGTLVAVTLPGGTSIEYVLDGRGRRIGKRVDGALLQGWLYADGLRPLAELDGAGTVVSRFVYAGRGNLPAYMIRGGVTYRIIGDHAGSARLVVDVGTGDVVQRLDYDAFGRVTLDTNAGFQPFGFAGGLYDPDTGLVRFGKRDYDAEVGRWTSRDPLAFGGGQSNLYAYAANDPVNNVDRTGLKPEDDALDALYEWAKELLPDKVKEWVGYGEDAKKVADNIDAINETMEQQDKTLGQQGREAVDNFFELCKIAFDYLPDGAPMADFIKDYFGEMFGTADKLLDQGAESIETYFDERVSPVEQPEPESSGFIPDELRQGTPYDRGYDDGSKAGRLAETLENMR